MNQLPSSILRFALLVSLFLPAASCSSGDKGEGIQTEGPTTGASSYMVETEVDPALIAAGHVAAVRCTATTSAGVKVDKPTSFAVFPSEGSVVTNEGVEGRLAGIYAVACALDDSLWLDSTPAPLKVVAGPPAVVTAVPEANALHAGESMTVDCLVTDAYGNPITGVTTKVVSQAGLPATDHTIQGEKAGDYIVECELPDAKPAPRSEGAPVTVEAGQVVSVELLADPPKDVYTRGEAVKLRWEALDELGNVVPDASGALEAPSDGLISPQPLTYKFIEQGRYLFRVTLLPPWPALSDELELLVDDEAPKLRILWPDRGATVQGDGTSPVVVEGTIEDAAGLAAFTINGQDVDVASDGSFAHPLPPRWGLTIIEAEAVDVLDKSIRLTPTFYYSTSYLPYGDASDAAAARLPNAATMAIGQVTFDDGIHDLAEPNDLATLFLLGLQAIDLGSLIPNLGLPPLELTLPNAIQLQLPGLLGGTVTLSGDLEISASLGALAFGPLDVSLDTRDGGIDAMFSLGDEDTPAFAVPLTIALTAPVTATVTIPNAFGGPALSFDFDLVGTGTIAGGFGVQTATLLAAIDAALQPGGDPVLSVADVLIDAGGIGALPVTEAVISFGTFNLPLIGPIPLDVDLLAIAPQLFDFIQLLSLDPLWELVEPLLADAFAPLLSTALEAIAEPLVSGLQIETVLPLPLLQDPNESVELAVSIGPDTAVFTDDGGQFGLGVGISAAKGIDRTPLGMPLRGQCLELGELGELAPSWQSPIELLGRTDTANALLFTLWWSGAFHAPLDLGALGGLGGGGIPLDGLVIRPYLYLPPLISDCEPTGSQLQVGDLFLEVEANVFGLPITVTAFLDAALDTDIVAGPDGWSMVLGEFERLDLEVVDVAGGLGGLFDLDSIIEDMLLPFLTDSLPGTVLGPIALPALDLSTLLPTLPPGTAIEFGGYTATSYPGREALGFALQ